MPVFGKRRSPAIPVLICFFWAAFPGNFVFAQSFGPAECPFLSSIGLSPAQVIRFFGEPKEALPFRGDREEEDMVCFYYSDHFYFFFFENRVWQIRFDRRYSDAVCSCTMGMTKGEIVRLLGQPFAEIDGSLIYHYSDNGYPIKVRLFFRYGRLDDVYLFRGDY